MTELLIQPDAMTAPAAWPPAEPLALPTPYELDPFQKHAVLGIHAGDHVFVTAKTGSGKTFVGEYLIARALAAGKRVFYTTPIKSLSNQKYHDLKQLFPGNSVGILTGDIKMCPDAQIVVMTAEILRNLFYKRGTATESVGLTAAVSLEGVAGIVMDEVHYIQDPDRGHVWEESLILCPRDLQLVLLSATMPSAAALAGWLATLHQRRVHLLSTTYRVVPLVHAVLAKDSQGGWKARPILDSRGAWNEGVFTSWLADRKALEDGAAAHKKAVEARRRDGYASGPASGKVRVEDPIAGLRRTLRWLSSEQHLPALFFVFSRRECERLAGLVEGSLLDTSEAAAAAHIVDFHLSRYSAILETMKQYHRIRDLLIRGIAFHHSGLQPLLKEIVEILFSRGLVRALFATETFSVGLNMPTKTVVFLELEKWADGGQRRLLRPDEYIQMAGRAGRRGKDTQGLVLYQPLRDPVSAYDLKSLLTGALPPLESRMRFHYEFLLRQRLSGDRLAIAENSYWAVQQSAARDQRRHELVELEIRLLGAQKAITGVQEADCLQLRALEAELAGSMNAKKKKAALALQRWKEEHSGSMWDALLKRYGVLEELQGHVARLRQEIAAWEGQPLVQTAALESCLRLWGFFGNDGELTEIGRAATEVNEGHPILMPLLAAEERCADLPAEDIACVLAGFLREGGGGPTEELPTLCETEVSAEARSALEWIDTAAQRCQREEDDAGIRGPADYWNLSTLWIAVARSWLDGMSLSAIATTWNLFEGNVQRGLLRIANLLAEWAAVAQIRNDLPMLEKIRGLRFLREEILVDSIYLRL